ALVVFPVSAQIQPTQVVPQPDQFPFDSAIQLLDFTNPTTIQGRLRLVDQGEQAIWLDWDWRLEGQSPGHKVWRGLEGDFMLLVYARDPSQFDTIKGLVLGTRLELVIQTNEKGHRVILSYVDVSHPPQTPL
ncbi:MAG TPA: hypothetical protein VFL31_04155, partial [Nitrospiraceae bacterium]|nr:hypothetical protein [Nitrospiraceae bacterium]